MISDGSTHEDDIGWLGSVGGDVNAFGNDSYTGGGKKDAIGFAARNHFGVATDDGNRGFLTGARSGGCDAIQIREWKAFFQDESDGECERRGPSHGDIVDASVGGKIADAATRKEQRTDDKGVRGYGYATRHGGQRPCIMTDRKLRAVEVTREQLLNKLMTGASAAAVNKLDATVGEIKRAKLMW